MKKLYKLAACEQTSSGIILLLDGKHARTPGKNPFLLPNKALAEAIVSEWQSQGKIIRKETMPLTQIACAAIDIFSDDKQLVTSNQQLLSYADTDLICYRAGDDAALEAQQAKLLDPIMAWAEERFGIALKVTGGVMPVSQPITNKAKLAAAMSEYDVWKLAALTASVKPLGSLILALALVESRIDAHAAFRLSHLEELYETEKWGRDEEKEKRLQGLKQEIEVVEFFLKLLYR